MKQACMIFLLTLITSCAVVVPMHPNNLKKWQLEYLKVGMTQEEIVKKVGEPAGYVSLSTEDQQKYGISDIMYYPLDIQENNVFRCSDLIIKFKRDRTNKLRATGFENLPPKQPRCTQYVRQYEVQSIQQRVDMQYLGNSMNQYIDSQTPSNNHNMNTCVHDVSCGRGQKCVKQANKYKGICVDIYYLKE